MKKPTCISSTITWLLALTHQTNAFGFAKNHNTAVNVTDLVIKAIYPHGFNSHLHIKTASLMLLNADKTQGYGIVYRIKEGTQAYSLHTINQAAPSPQTDMDSLHTYIAKRPRLLNMKKDHIPG